MTTPPTPLPRQNSPKVNEYDKPARILAGIVYDKWSRGRIHPVYVWGGAALVISVPLRLALSSTAAWRAFAEWLTR